MSSIGQGSISIDDSTRIGENAQDTANKVAGNVNDINSDNKLTPSEKIKLKQEYDKDSKLYTIDASQLHSVGLPTAELETAMSNLTKFVTPLFNEMNKTSTIDRDVLNSVFTAFAVVDKNAAQAFVNMVQQVADDAKKAGDDAKVAGDNAQKMGAEAKASAEQAKTDATQAKTDAATAQQKAQSSIDQLTAHLPDINEALSTANLVKQNVTKLSDTTEQYHNEYTTGIQNVVKTIDDISVGGRNYILNSDFYITSGQKNVLSSVEPNEYSGKKIIVSVDIEINNLKTIADSGYTRVGYEASFHASDNSTVYVGVWKSLTKSDIGKSFKYRATSDTYDLTQKTITSINDGNKALGGVYIQGITADSIKIGHPKLEIATKATDWTPAPEDLATNAEFDQLSNAIKLKVDSADVTSQINVATKGIQNEVDNKVTDLNTKISQTSDAVQILNTTSGLRNLVYNSSYANNAEGWNMFNQTGYLSTLAVSSYNGSPGFGVSVSGKGASIWTQFGQSKHYTLPQPDAVATENTYSGSAMIKMYDDSDSEAKLSATIAYYDKNGARITGWKDMVIDYSQKLVWTEVKFENLPVPKGAYSIGMQYWACGAKVHGMIVQPMIVFGPKIGPYNPDAVSQSDITASIGNIHLGVKNADGSTSNFNMNGNTIFMDTAQTVINGKTSILDGTINTAKIANAAINTAQIADGAINNAKIANASIDDAKISNLNGNKIIARSIAASKINVDDLIANGINTKTLTSVNLNTSTLTTPELDLGLNGTFTEDFNYTQPTSFFLPKKNIGTLTFNHGVLQSKGTMQTYVNGQWGGMNDQLTFQAGTNNTQWTELAPGYIKMDLCKTDGSAGQRIYADPTGFYYTSATGNKSYLGNVLQTGQVQSGSILGKYIGPMDGQLRLQIGSNGNDYGLQVGSYAGNEAVLSDFIYSSTSGASANVRITDNGHLMRTTSASKYKYNIKNPDIETTLGDRLLNVHMATWNDKRAVDLYAEQLNTGEEREKSTIDKYYGLIAEQLRDAGLEMFIDYGKNHEIEGVRYDRAWIPLLSVIRRLNNKVNEYELRLSKLEGANK
ncbi:cell envelope integrity protein TolA [Pediococcus pentosaceus]|uniref:cell envelope integrity protein TolA n=1 Tax=Pediococcus pentosaceus TaxID=1255 RepID=UPI0010485675|nr:cell envelope integrity protein TolA [Pediococcus pentosaceus]